jgi:hypothetical protein
MRQSLLFKPKTRADAEARLAVVIRVRGACSAGACACCSLRTCNWPREKRAATQPCSAVRLVPAARACGFQRHVLLRRACAGVWGCRGFLMYKYVFLQRQTALPCAIQNTPGMKTQGWPRLYSWCVFHAPSAPSLSSSTALSASLLRPPPLPINVGYMHME